MSSKLNPEQLEAINAPFGRTLVIASAGTGKTSTIVGRIEALLYRGIAPANILLLTFTNKAASEMLQRVAKNFPKEVEQIMAGTFHAVSYKILKMLDENIILKQPGEIKTVFRSAYEEYVGLEKKSRYASNSLFELYSLYLNSNIETGFGEFITNYNEDHLEYSHEYERITTLFELIKAKYNYVGFDDLLIKARDKVSASDLFFKEALVDEYQDTNPLQNTFINNATDESLFCVGDYDQSIYAFNGSDISIISNFSKVYENARVYNLSKNYRSTRSILSLADRVISNNERIYPKKLEVMRTQSDIAPQLLIYMETFEQYQEIAKRIQKSKTPPNDISVIFRNNASADGIEISLKELGVGVRRKGGQSFFETKEVKAVFDFLNIIVYKKDIISFIEILKYAKGLGNKAASSIYESLIENSGNIVSGFLSPQKQTVFKHEFNLFGENITKQKQFDGTPVGFVNNPILQYSKIDDSNASFLNGLYELFEKTQHERHPATLIDKIIKSKVYLDIKEQIASSRAFKNNSVDPSLKKEVLVNIDQKTQLLKDIAKQHRDIVRFINAMMLSGNEISQKEGVNLLTVHSSKGLEFDEVYVIDLMEGRFPNSKLISKNSGSLEEERRLFYVCVTRAKNLLYLSYAKHDRAKNLSHKPSIFLKEAKLVKDDE